MRIPVRAIHQIEITSRCNLRCRYCPQFPKLPRPMVDMTEETFDKALDWAARLYRTYRAQTELNLAGIGESTIHPQFESFVLKARKALPTVELILATNGIKVTESMAMVFREAQVRVWVSLHRPEKAAHAIPLLKRFGVLQAVSCDGAINSVDWAGQVDWPVTTPTKGQVCDWVRNGRVEVMADGRVTTCCFDATGSGVIGTLDDDLFTKSVAPYKLCSTCHLDVGVKAEAVA